MELLYIFVPIFVYAIAKTAIEHRTRAREQNVRLLEEALKSPHIDRPTLESLTYQLTGHRARPASGSKFLAIVLAVGWLAVFTGIAMWIAGATMGSGYRDLIVGGIVTGVVGFALVTYPFALRELESRLQPQ